MFLRQLSSSGSSFLPRCRAASSHLPFRRAPHPWWSAWGFPPWPPRPPCPLPQATSSSINPVCSLYTRPALLMERPDRDREPPHKRRKCAEEKRSMEEREGHRGGAVGGETGGSKRQQQEHPDSSSDSRPRPKHRFKEWSRERGHSEAGRCVSKENGRDKDGGGWTRTRRDQTTDRGRSAQQRGEAEDPQPARTRTRPSEPEQGNVPLRGHNAWFQEPEGRGSDRSSEGGQWTGLLSRQAAGADGTPVRPPNDKPPAKSLHRHWETPACSTDVQPPGDSTAFDFSVLSYNILSQELLQDNAYLYRHCHPAVLPWSHRLPNLLAEIRQHDADILCLQEVQEDHYQDQIQPALQALGYQCEYKKRTGRKPDGCAVIFKSSRLSLLSSTPVEFFRPGDALLDRDNVGLVVLLRPNDAAARSDPSARVCVANTHLLYNPRRGDIKLAQLAILLAEIGRLSRLPDGSSGPVVLCGDFNSTPRSPLYSFLTTGRLDYRGLQIGSVSGQENSPRGQRLLTSPLWSHSLGIDSQCLYVKKSAVSPCGRPTVEGAISNLTVEDVAATAAVDFNRLRIEHSLKLQSSYQHHLPPDGRPEITTCHSHTAMTVDYILYTPEFIAPPSPPCGRGLSLLGRLSLVGQPELEEVNGLPNRHHSSDHLPLLARFRLRR